MIVYVPSSVADALSSELWQLSRPPAVAANDTTMALFAVVTATDGTHWLVCDTSFEVPVHPDAELDGIADILQPWIDAGYLPADTNTQLAALVESQRGQRLVVYDFFPQPFKDMSMTYERMIAAGLLVEPDLT